MSKINEFLILDLFCGAGGFSYGMHRNPHFKTVVALDFNDKAANTFKMNMPDVFSFSTSDKKQFLRGFCDVTGYIRRSNYFIDNYKHRVYIEIPQNWFMVVDICNLLKSIDIPVQNIDWGHPNMRDGNLKKYNEGKPLFWKKEHQIKIFANEFLPIGFGVIHKNKALTEFAKELIEGFKRNGVDATDITHRFYWDFDGKRKVKPPHPSEDDLFIPAEIRGKHYDSWKEIAKDLGYGK